MNSKKPTAACSASRYPAGRGPQRSHEDFLREARCDSSLKSIAFVAMHGTLTRLYDRARRAAPLAFAVLLLWGLAGAFADYLDRPEVHVSHLTQECVRVVNADGSPGSCGALPDRYARVWVE